MLWANPGAGHERAESPGSRSQGTRGRAPGLSPPTLTPRAHRAGRRHLGAASRHPRRFPRGVPLPGEQPPGRTAMSAGARRVPRGSRAQPLAPLCCVWAALGMLGSPSSQAFNLDVDKLTVYSGPEGSYFGYAVDFHLPAAHT